MVILQTYFCTLQEGKQARTAQHRLQIHWCFTALKQWLPSFQKSTVTHYSEQYGLENYLHFYNHLTCTEYKPA